MNSDINQFLGQSFEQSLGQPCRSVIIGRPNVGKSTLFNRLIGRKRALVHNLPGVTRDRLEEEGEWIVAGKNFSIVLTDTGGLKGDQFSEEISQQVDIALENADVVLFVFDGQTGLTPVDEELFLELQRSGIFKRIPILGVINKVDLEMHEHRISDFFSLGIESLLTVSAEHGRGMEDLKMAIAQTVGFFDPQNFSEIPTIAPKTAIARVALVGRPNVGKSTLMNTLLGENRMITSSVAGTTVDSVDSWVHLQERPFVFIDTAGIRRKSKTEKGVECLSVVQTKKALERADVAILILDAEEGVSDQDEKLGGLIEQAGCSIILVVNKWDTHKNNRKFTPEIAAERIRKQMAFLKYAPILFVSALKKQGLENLGDLIEEIMRQRKFKMPTHELTEWIRQECMIHNPMNAKFYLCHQMGRNPPTFTCRVNDPKKVHFSLQRHLVNGIRQRWGYMGTPIRLLILPRK
jgi:GTP-binding protein